MDGSRELNLAASFASGVLVRAALVQPWSVGQTEGQVHKLTLGKCQMYGRAKIGLLQASPIGAP
jgi:transposase